eukprot:m.843596 g.843596  ORF g.843596 m.843596 type:complete len:96 (+) comp23473_c1_seq7:619-906(+)
MESKHFAQKSTLFTFDFCFAQSYMKLVQVLMLYQLATERLQKWKMVALVQFHLWNLKVKGTRKRMCGSHVIITRLYDRRMRKMMKITPATRYIPL